MFISIKMELDFFACINFSAFEWCSSKTNRERRKGLRGGCQEQELRKGKKLLPKFCICLGYSFNMTVWALLKKLPLIIT